MPTPVLLPRCTWGAVDAPRRALLIHGLGSNGALMWRFGTALADAGWRADAVDLRGHGTAPRTLDYTLDAYGADVGATAPDGAAVRSWDLVIGHSLGGAAAVLASAADPEWTRRLVLIDPGLRLVEADRVVVRQGLEASFDDPTAEAIRAAHPTWHPQDVELKVRATSEASRWAVEQTSTQNATWDVMDAAARLQVPTHIIGADPAVYSIFHGPIAEEFVRSGRATMSVVAGAGHSPHRDDPDATIARLFEALA